MDYERPKEFLDVYLVLEAGIKKGYPADNWLLPEGQNTQKKQQYGSIFRHVAEGYADIKIDKETGLDPRLQAACRLLMDYTRDKRGIIHPEDK